MLLFIRTSYDLQPIHTERQPERRLSFLANEENADLLLDKWVLVGAADIFSSIPQRSKDPDLMKKLHTRTRQCALENGFLEGDRGAMRLSLTDKALNSVFTA